MTPPAKTSGQRAPRATDGTRPRRKATTRNDLLQAAEEIFSTTGTIDVTVETVCRHAGYTRGAFYSSFDTVEELFFALWERMTERFEETREDLDPRQFAPGTAHASTEPVRSLLAVFGRPQWFSLRTVLVARARRRPELAARLRARMRVAAARLQPQLILWSEVSGRRLTVPPEVFTWAVMAAYDGALGNELFADGEEVLVAAVTGVMLGLTEPTPHDAGPGC